MPKPPEEPKTTDLRLNLVIEGPRPIIEKFVHLIEALLKYGMEHRLIGYSLNTAESRMDKPQEQDRRAISGSAISSRSGIGTGG